MKRGTISVLLIALQISCSTALLAQGDGTASVLFQQLRARATTDQAKHALLGQAVVDPQVRKYIAERLPTMIEMRGKGMGRQWMNAVALAGELQIAEAAPSLGKWIGLDNIGQTTAAQFQRLETNPAGKALAQIGDPAIPTLELILEHGSYRERLDAYLVLRQIDSKSARDAIHARLDREVDPNLKEMILRFPSQND